MSRATYAELDPLSAGRIQDKRRLADELRAIDWPDLGALFDRFADRDEAELVTRVELQRARGDIPDGK